MRPVAPYHLVNNPFCRWYIYHILNSPYRCVCVWDSWVNYFCFILHANTVGAIVPITLKDKELLSKNERAHSSRLLLEWFLLCSFQMNFKVIVKLWKEEMTQWVRAPPVQVWLPEVRSPQLQWKVKSRHTVIPVLARWRWEPCWGLLADSLARSSVRDLVSKA